MKPEPSERVRDEEMRKLFQSVQVDVSDDGFKGQLRADLLEKARAWEKSKPLPPARSPRTIPLFKVAWAAAAAVVIAAGAWWLLGGGTKVASADLAAVIARIRAATSVSFRRTVYISGNLENQSQVYVAPGHMRAASEDRIVIRDDARDLELSLNVPEKTARLAKVANGSVDQDFLDRLRNIHAGNGRRIGFDDVSGHRAVLYEVRQNDSTVRIWADGESDVPLRVEIRTMGSQYRGVVETMDDFLWNSSIDQELFSMELPAGFRFRVNDAPIDEQSLVELLRTCANLSGGVFPEQLDEATVNNLILEDLRRRLPERITSYQEGDTTRWEVNPDSAMNASIQVCSRGLKFIEMIGQVSVCKYEGGGVKLGDSSKPAFSWGLPGGTSYKVIYGDLSCRVVTLSRKGLLDSSQSR